ncbi:MAG TPA: hypothetical protein VM737_11920 [Gemmatimonadota bacterium]|nr:hypothetical protein [Gemmatimonadota bacterium]
MRPQRLDLLAIVALAVLAPALAWGEDAKSIPRTPDGRPDLSGTYDVATLTPLQRPAHFGDQLFLTPEEAARIEEEERARMVLANQESDPDREAPPEGGDGSEGAAGNVGGYNAFWIDRGTGAFEIDGKYRTSILVDPPNGQFPPVTPEVSQRAASQRRQFRENRGDAWWVGLEGPGPYDDPELRGLGERCLLGFGSTSGPPMLPVLYNNLKKIVQTPDHVTILVEMNHDARVVRMNSEHLPPEIRRWMGDSVGWWEGDTLVVDTTNFNDSPALRQADRNLHVVERFTRIDRDRLLYQFTVEDPTVWTEPWSGEYIWPATGDRVFEYACHEGNYALGNILRGARLLEAEALAKTSGNE